MLYASPTITAYSLFIAALLGLVMGSFLECLAWRIVHEESVLRGRSHCDACDHELGIRDLIPVLSWVLSGGKCRYCGTKISAKHPVGEIVCAVLYVSVVARYGLTLEAVEMLVFASALFVLTFTDIEDFLIPLGTIVTALAARVVFIVAAYGMLAGGIDVSFVFANPLQYAGTPADIAFALVRDSLIGGLGIGAAVLLIVLIMDRVLGRESMGGGDIMLLAVAGLYFGWQQSLFLIIVACLMGLLFAALRMKQDSREYDQDKKLAEDIKDKTGHDAALERAQMPEFPFGPSIALACWVTMLFGAQVVAWYMGFFW